MNSRLWLAASLIVLLARPALAQDPDIDRLLRKLPPPEKVVTRIAPLRQNADPALQDPSAPALVKKLAAGKAGEGLSAARKLAQRYPGSPVAHFLQATSAMARNQNSEAAAAFRKVISIAPQWAQAHFGLGLAEGQQNRFAAALPHLQKAAQLDPNQAPVFFFLSACFERLGRKQESLTAARRAVQLAPKTSIAWAMLARAESALGHRAEALLAAGKAFRLGPDAPAVATAASAGSLNLNRPVEGVRILQRAVELEPKNKLLRKQLKDFQTLAAQTNQSVPRLQKNAAAQPDSGRAWLELGDCLRETRTAQGRRRRLCQSPPSLAGRSRCPNQHGSSAKTLTARCHRPPAFRMTRHLAFLILLTATARLSAAPPATMPAVVAHEYGRPDVVKFEQIPRPEPKDDEALRARDGQRREPGRSADRERQVCEGIRHASAADSWL